MKKKEKLIVWTSCDASYKMAQLMVIKLLFPSEEEMAVASLWCHHMICQSSPRGRAHSFPKQNRSITYMLTEKIKHINYKNKKSYSKKHLIFPWSSNCNCPFSQINAMSHLWCTWVLAVLKIFLTSFRRWTASLRVTTLALHIITRANPSTSWSTLRSVTSCLTRTTFPSPEFLS